MLGEIAERAYLCLHSKQTLKKGTSYGRIYSTQKETIPYGMMNFAVIRRDDCYYVDKTRFIPIIEDVDKFFFIRPRRFGKSLTVSMLQHYYDIAAKDLLSQMFPHLRFSTLLNLRYQM